MKNDEIKNSHHVYNLLNRVTVIYKVAQNVAAKFPQYIFIYW